MKKVQVQCNPHPDAPHGFSRNSSHSLGRYVCDCEGWTPDESPSIAPTFTADTQGEIIGYLAPDCRTCDNRYNGEIVWQCDHDCTNGDKYQEATKVVLWRTE